MSALRADGEKCREFLASTGLPPSVGNDLDLLVGGSQFVPAILEAIAGAQESVLIEVFTLRRGVLASTFVDALAECARRGVEVRLVLDSIGSRFLPSRLLHQLRRNGVAVHFFGRFRWSDPQRYLVRNHRKTFTIDYRLAFIGGMSVDDVFIGARDCRAWHEVMLCVRGPLAMGIAEMFAATYTELAGEALRGRPNDVGNVSDRSGEVLLASAPGVARGRDAYIQLFRSARRSIELTTPYFAPEDAALKELIDAARRGVDVRIITAGVHTNARIVRVIAHSYYPELLAAGVRIFEPITRMTHAKTILVDKATWIVGSTNIDARSFYVNLEADVLSCDGTIADSLATTFALLEAESKEICRDAVGRPREALLAGCARFLARYV